MASFAITIGGAGTTDPVATAQTALMLAFVAASRSAGRDRAQTVALWAEFQKQPVPTDVGSLWDSLLTVLSPPTS